MKRARRWRNRDSFPFGGGIIDIFDMTEENPYRIELWGDEVDSIRSFDPESQRSITQMDSVLIYPAAELTLTKEQMENGTDRIEKEGKKQEKAFREAGSPRRPTGSRLPWGNCARP